MDRTTTKRIVIYHPEKNATSKRQQQPRSSEKKYSPTTGNVGYLCRHELTDEWLTYTPPYSDTPSPQRVILTRWISSGGPPRDDDRPWWPIRRRRRRKNRSQTRTHLPHHRSLSRIHNRGRSSWMAASLQPLTLPRSAIISVCRRWKEEEERKRDLGISYILFDVFRELKTVCSWGYGYENEIKIMDDPCSLSPLPE
ncbi:hypothetical protein TanjilG_08918 [Lupinus angustifolius]|uniref:Uncharacterized protein n=1 Tax=Lupinus angustifolius TaxID=3871 RepID=A0A4P1RVW7_LUPAN|nr:hypothetical protein TanjilG_08918 [Lupinus angustifolius]